MSIRTLSLARTGGLVAIIALGAWAMAASSWASDVEILEALRECPDTEIACLYMDASLKWPGERDEDMAKHPSVHRTVVDEKDDSFTHVYVRVTGRLDGGAAKPYHLKLTRYIGGIECEDFLMAALESRPEGGGVILTRQGILDILSAEIEIGYRNTIALIDPDSGRKIARLDPGWESPAPGVDWFVKQDGRVFWRSPTGLCLDIDTNGPFRRVAGEACTGDKLFEASQEDIERVRKMGIFTDKHTIERLQHDLWRLEGATFLIYIWGVACT